MYTCSNCTAQFQSNGVDDIVVTHKGHIAAILCPDCTKGVRVLKVALRRDDNGNFNYDQFTPVEMQAKAFGKAG